MKNAIITKIENYLSFTIFGLALITLTISLFFPIYTDEIIWKVIQGRYWMDGGQVITPSPSCGVYTHSVPIILIPFRILNSLLFDVFSNPFSIRLFGIGMALLWVVVTWRLFCNLLWERLQSKTIFSCLIAFSTLGVLPFLLVLSRPEQFLLLFMTIFFIPLLKETPKQKLDYKKSYLNGMIIFFVTCFMLASHPKAILALPLIFAFIYRFVQVRWAALFFMLAVAIFSVIVFRDWSMRLDCPANPFIKAAIQRSYLGSITNFSEFKYYFNYLFSKLLYPVTWYIFFIIPRVGYGSSIIPPFFDSGSLWFGSILRILFTGVTAVTFFLFVDHVFNWRKIHSRLSLVAVGSIWIFYFGCVLGRAEKGDYEASLMVPLLALAIAGSLFLKWPSFEAYYGKQKVVLYGRIGFLILLTLSFCSQVFFIKNYIPYISSWRQPFYLQNQRFSIPNFHYDQLRPKILEAAKKCGIQSGAHLNHLVVDELTYFSFKKSYQPMFMTYLDENGWGKLYPDPTELLTYYKSSGMIVGCQWIPTALQKKAIHAGQFCCLPAFVG